MGVFIAENRMQIYIMRHGQAEMTADSDAERSLTAIGIAESQKMAVYLADKGVVFDAVIVSPYLRAQQTWKAVSTFFPPVNNIQIIKQLTPSGSAFKSVNEIMALQIAGVEVLLVVSHLPLVGYIIGELAPEAGVPAFSTSSVGHLQLDANGFAELLSLTAVSQIR